MKQLYRLGLIILMLVFVQILAQAQTNSLTTTTAGGNGASGNYFDITAHNTITVTGFDINLSGTATVSVYFKEGTWSGSEANAGAWTLLGSATVTGSGTFTASGNTLTYLPVGGLTIPAGQTYGIFIHTPQISTITYTASGFNTFSNSDLTISTGAGANYIPFAGAIFIPRTWNGRVHYTTGSLVDANGMPLPAFYDGRINNYDTAAPVAVYPHLVDNEVGLIIYNSEGVQLLLISPEQIAGVPDNPDSNLLIATQNNIALYRISGADRGYWQINAPQYNGKTYVMIFPELYHSGGYESFEIGG